MGNILVVTEVSTLLIITRAENRLGTVVILSLNNITYRLLIANVFWPETANT